MAMTVSTLLVGGLRKPKKPEIPVGDWGMISWKQNEWRTADEVNRDTLTLPFSPTDSLVLSSGILTNWPPLS